MGIFQVFQRLGKHFLGNAGHEAAEFAGTERTVSQMAENTELPFSPDNVKGRFYGKMINLSQKFLPPFFSYYILFETFWFL